MLAREEEELKVSTFSHPIEHFVSCRQRKTRNPKYFEAAEQKLDITLKKDIRHQRPID